MRDGSQIHSTLSARITSQDCSLAPPPLRGWAGSFYPAGMARTTQYLSRMTRTQTASSQREKGITLCMPMPFKRAAQRARLRRKLDVGLTEKRLGSAADSTT